MAKAREGRKNKAADTLVKLCKLYVEGRNATVKAQVEEWGDLLERVASLTNDLMSKNLELPAMSGLGAEPAQLGKELCEAWKEIES